MENPDPERYGFKQSDSDAKPAVSFDHVTFRYRSAGDDALEDLTFTAKRGQTIGIIGGTGSGKTSLVSLIPRFYDVSSGSVSVNGRDVRAYEPDELRAKVGIVMQKPVLFKGTIRSNLLWGNEDATDEDMLEAIRAAQAEDVVLAHTDEVNASNAASINTVGETAKDTAKDTEKGTVGAGKADAAGNGRKQADAALLAGLDAPVEQEGRNFSGGQKQRLTIARALVRHPEILILDDSASALDFATDARLRKAIRELNMKNGAMTVFIVSQRTSSIAHADQIIVLEDGRVAGIGTHEELLKSCKVYQETHYAQFPKTEAASTSEPAAARNSGSPVRAGQNAGKEVLA